MSFFKQYRLTPKIIFDSDHVRDDIRRKSIRGGTFIMAAQASNFAINMGRTFVLARLLTPQDFGIIAMVAVIVGFAEMFKDAGLSMATVQRQDISEPQISTLFWINVLISFILGLCIIGSAPLIASFYGRQELIAVTISLAIPFFIRGIIIQHQALLNRHMRFGFLAIEHIIATVAGLLVAIVLASFGLSYWALIGSVITIATTNAILTFYFCPWLPGKPVRGTGAFQMLKFGSYLTAFNFINYFSRNADNILIGKFIGASELGFYNKAYQLFLLPISQIRNPISRIAMPVLSSLQNDHKRYSNYFYKMIDIIATVSFPLSFCLYLEAKIIILVVLGPQWEQSIPVFKVLALYGIISPVVGTRGLVLMSLGKSRKFFFLGVVIAIVSVSSFIIGLPYGINGVATAYVVAQYALVLPTLYYSFYQTPVQVLSFYKIIIVPALIVTMSALGPLIVDYIIDAETIIVNIFSIVLFFSIYIGLTLFRRSFRKTCKTTFKTFFSKKNNNG